MLEEANFSRNPKKGSGKNKGKPLFKCFNCEEVGHCAAKFPYLKIGKNNEKDDSIFKNYKNDKTEKRENSYRQRKNLHINEDNSCFDDSDSETKRFSSRP
jgi:hypothetical protein